MTENFQRPLPSIDRMINEIPTGRSRSKIIATIVDYNHPQLIINDGLDQLEATIPGYVNVPYDKISLGVTGRFLIDIEETKDEKSSVKILAFHPMSIEQVNKYKQLVKIERSQSK